MNTKKHEWGTRPSGRTRVFGSCLLVSIRGSAEKGAIT